MERVQGKKHFMISTKVLKITMPIITAVTLEMEARQTQEKQVNKHSSLKRYSNNKPSSKHKAKQSFRESNKRSRALKGNSNNNNNCINYNSFNSVKIHKQDQEALKIITQVHRALVILNGLFQEAKAERKLEKGLFL